MGRAGAVRRPAWGITTLAADGGRPTDLVDRNFVATRPRRLRVSDFTYVATWSGFVYVELLRNVPNRQGTLTPSSDSRTEAPANKCSRSRLELRQDLHLIALSDEKGLAQSFSGTRRVMRRDRHV